MSSVKVMPSVFKGEVTLPPSKSDVHRAILCAALSKVKALYHLLICHRIFLQP